MIHCLVSQTVSSRYQRSYTAATSSLWFECWTGCTARLYQSLDSSSSLCYCPLTLYCIGFGTPPSYALQRDRTWDIAKSVPSLPLVSQTWALSYSIDVKLFTDKWCRWVLHLLSHGLSSYGSFLASEQFKYPWIHFVSPSARSLSPYIVDQQKLISKPCHCSVAASRWPPSVDKRSSVFTPTPEVYFFPQFFQDASVLIAVLCKCPFVGGNRVLVIGYCIYLFLLTRS